MLTLADESQTWKCPARELGENHRRWAIRMPTLFGLFVGHGHTKWWDRMRLGKRRDLHRLVSGPAVRVVLSGPLRD
jgi:hypothetical protein